MRAHSRQHLKFHALLAERACIMRHNPTETEQLLWGELAGSRLGVSFRRQFVVGRFVADFAAPSKRIIVEVDGGYHALRTRADAARDDKLRRLGWRVIHIPAEGILHNLPAAVATIRLALEGGIHCTAEPLDVR